MASRTGNNLTFAFLLAGVVAAFAIMLAQQRGAERALRSERAEALRAAETARSLAAANESLRHAQISEAELQRLRSDHAALPRLRAELAALQKAEGTEQPGR